MAVGKHLHTKDDGLFMSADTHRLLPGKFLEGEARAAAEVQNAPGLRHRPATARHASAEVHSPAQGAATAYRADLAPASAAAFTASASSGAAAAALPVQPFVFPTFITRPSGASRSPKTSAVAWNRKYERILTLTDALVVFRRSADRNSRAVRHTGGRTACRAGRNDLLGLLAAAGRRLAAGAAHLPQPRPEDRGHGDG